MRRKIVYECMNGIEVDRVEVMQYLGIMIDDRLSFKDHCEYRLKKLGKEVF